MGTKTKYNLMLPSTEVADENGNFYPDVATFNINYFIPQNKPLDYQLKFNDLYRFDLFINSFYANFDFYDDIILWLNNIPYLTASGLEQNIKLYVKGDLDSYYSANVF